MERTAEELTAIKREALAGALRERARRHFRYFCMMKTPTFYRPERAYLMELCDTLEEFAASEKRMLVINMPPRHGKSLTASHFVEWMLGRDRTQKIMTCSYNEILSSRFSKKVRNDIDEIKADAATIVYSDIFPETKIKQGDAAMGLWSLEGADSSYLATSPTGTATGFGATLVIVDDIIKNDIEAKNETAKARQWAWFTDTMQSRLEEGGKCIVIMTRWASDDVAGRVLKSYPPEDVMHVNFKALQDSGEMLCEDILSRKSYEERKKLMGEDILLANYQQTPIDLKNRLYNNLKIYEDVPRNAAGRPLFTAVKCYIDTADTGADYLAAIVYGVYNAEAYVLDVLYTSEPMEKTEPQTAEMLHRNDVRICDVESNNGGRGFARNVATLLKSRYKSNRCRVVWFHQSQNKEARILSNSTWIEDHVYFPANWRDRFPDFYEAVTRYQRGGKNAHDDAADALTGVCEKIGRGGIRINPAIL